MAACAACEGTGFVLEEKDGRAFARPCACRASDATPGRAGFLRGARIPPRYEHCELKSFEPHTPSHAAALEKVMRYCNGYPFLGADEGLGLLLTGNTGVGKTHLAVSVLRELFERKGARGQFWDFHELIREIKNSYDPETKMSEVQVLAPIIEVDVLVLDDLGAWRITDWMNDTLFHVLNSRYLARRPTLITTNFRDVSPEEAEAADPALRKEFFVERIGYRLRSRLREMCLHIEISAPDYREHRQQGTAFSVLGAAETPRPAPPPPRRPRFGG